MGQNAVVLEQRMEVRFEDVIDQNEEIIDDVDEEMHVISVPQKDEDPEICMISFHPSVERGDRDLERLGYPPDSGRSEVLHEEDTKHEEYGE